MPSNTPETQALEPCPFCGGKAFPEPPSLGRSHWNVICDDCGVSGPHGHDDEQAIRRWNQRHRQSSSNAGGVGVDDRKRIMEIIGNSTFAKGPKADLILDHFRERLASLSTPTAEPMGEPVALLQENLETGDVEVELFRDGAARLTKADRAAGWTETELYALTTPPTPHEFVKNPLIPFPSCQVCMGPEDAEAHSTPTPDRIGKDAVREAAEEARNVLAWIFETSDDHQSAMKAETAWRKLDAALAATPAQEGGR